MAGKITAVFAALHNVCIDFKMETPEIDIIPDTQNSSNFEVNNDMDALNTRSAIMQSLNV